MGYSKIAIRGIGWMWALRVLTRGLSFLRIAVIARILTPASFGLYGIAALVLSFVEVLTESGINILIIQDKENLNKIINTAWIISIFRGILIFIIILLTTPLIVNFFNTPNALNLILLISIVPLIRGFINPAVIKFQKDLEFKNELLFRGFIFFVESILAIIFVFLLKSPEGIVFSLIIGALFEVILSFIVIRPRPYFEIDRTKLREVFSRGKWLTAGGIFNYLYHHGDDAIVGRLLGPASLGIYDMAYRISMLPITEIGETISKVIFPVYTRISDDNKRLKKAFLKTMTSTSIFSLSIGIVFYFFAEQIVHLLLGSQWVDAIPVFRALAIFAVIRTLLNPAYSLFLAVSKQQYNTVITFVSFSTMIISILPLINSFGLLGAVYAVILGSVVAVPMATYCIAKVFKTK